SAVITEEEVPAESEEDTAAASSEETAVSSTPTAASTSTAAATVVDESKTDPQVYKDMFYYIFLFIVICAIVSIMNRILSIYKLTQVMNGKYNPIKENSFHAVLFLIFLVFFLYGVYYSYDVWGRWAFREAATEHGKKIDMMFIVTTIITTFVLVVMHIVI